MLSRHVAEGLTIISYMPLPKTPYVQFRLAEGCWITVQDYEYTFEGGMVRIIIGANNNPYPREISITFQKSDCMGMDRVLLVGQDGTEEPIIRRNKTLSKTEQTKI